MAVRVRRPLSFVAAGVALVALDFRTDLPDLLPDPVGWALVAVGAWSLAVRSAALLAAVAAVASLAETALPYRYVYVNPQTGEVANDEVGELYGFPVDQRWPDVSDGRALAIGAAYAAGGLALWLVLRVVGRGASATGDGAAAGRLRALRAVVPAVWSLPALVIIGMAIAGDDRYDPVWDGNLELVGLAGVLVLGWLGVRCALDRDQPWARHPVPVRPSLRGTWS